MASLFTKDNQLGSVIEELTRELADTRSRCRRLEDLLGIGPDESLPGRNEVIARAERDAALIRVTAQRFADQLMDRAARKARAQLAQFPPPQAPPPQIPPHQAPSHQPASHQPASHQAPSHQAPMHQTPMRPRGANPSLVYGPPPRPPEPEFQELWSGRDRVADLWGVDADQLDANIDRFMSTTAEG